MEYLPRDFYPVPDNNVILDQLYASARWRNLRLDLGMIHPKEEYNGISSTNGNFIRSGNSRTFPGYNLNSEYMKVPCTKGVLSIKFNWADYMMIDDRYVEDTRLHNKSAFLKIKPHQRWEIIVGLEHWAQWAGTSPVEANNLHHSRIISESFVPKKEEPGQCKRFDQCVRKSPGKGTFDH